MVLFNDVWYVPKGGKLFVQGLCGARNSIQIGKGHVDLSRLPYLPHLPIETRD